MEDKIVKIKAGTKIVIGVDAGFAGSESMSAYILTKDYTDDELYDIAWREALQHAEMYGVYPRDYQTEEDDEEDDGDQYSDNIDGGWAFYNEEEHAGHCSSSNVVTFNEL
jgi:hypothetical protein